MENTGCQVEPWTKFYWVSKKAVNFFTLFISIHACTPWF